MEKKRLILLTTAANKARITVYDDPKKLEEAFVNNLDLLRGKSLRFEEQIDNLTHQIVAVQTDIAYGADTPENNELLRSFETELYFTRLDHLALRIEVY